MINGFPNKILYKETHVVYSSCRLGNLAYKLGTSYIANCEYIHVSFPNMTAIVIIWYWYLLAVPWF